jgi:hypothetical protein
METFTKIICQGLPSIYPSYSFTDRKYILNRIKRLDFYDEKFITDDKFSTINDNNKVERTIQTLLYSKYELFLSAKEDFNAKLLMFPEYLTIYLTNGTVHTAKILELSDGENLGDTLNKLYRIVYYDINSANYLGGTQPVNDFLKSSGLTPQFDPLQLNRIFIQSPYLSTGGADMGYIDSIWCAAYNQNYTFYTKLNPFFEETELVEKTSELNGLVKVSNSKSQSVIKLRFYCSEVEKNIMAKYMPRCSDIVGRTTITYNLTSYIALERVIPEIKKVEGAVDLWQCDITLKYENLNFNHYVLPVYECEAGITKGGGFGT